MDVRKKIEKALEYLNGEYASEDEMPTHVYEAVIILKSIINL